MGGVIISGGDTAAADFFIINLPLRTGHSWLAMLVFIGGFSASAGMVIVESVVISTMILNHLVMPVILKLRIDYSDMSGVLVTIKRMGIITVVFLGYLYYRFIGESYTLTNIGFAAFVATSQFAPAVVGGLYWKRATRIGAITGLLLGFVFWFYTILIPLFVRSGWMESNILDKGLFGLAILRPLELFGLSGFEMLPHSLFWTLFFNLGAFIGISLLTDPDKNEAEQAIKFVDVFKVREEPFPRERMSKAPAIVEFVDLMTKFIGEKEAQAAIAEYLGDKQIDERGSLSEYELPILKRYTEKVLAGSVGAASAGIIIESYMAARGSELEEVFDIFGSVTLGRTTSREQLGVLYEAARVVASGADLKTIQDNILELLRQQFKLDLCMIRMLDEERTVLTVRSQKGTFWWDPKESERGLTMESYAGAAFLTNSEVVVNDVDLMDKPSSIRFAHLKGIKSFAHAPITIEGKPIGVLSAYSESARGMFTDEFKELFTMLAGQIGVAWRNASQTEKLIEAKKRERELQIARTIQLGLLPHCAPDVAGIAIAGRCVPASEVGGDYYDFLLRDGKALDLVIADVSGHNIGAALIMAEARTFIQSIAKNRLRPKEVLSALNEFLYEDLTRAEFFISMFYLKFDCDCHELFFASAGHNPPLVWKKSSRSCFWLDAEGLLLGVKKEVNFEEKQMSLQSGDILMMYTDGITEAADQTGAFFGEHRLRTLLGESCQLSPQEIIDKLFREVRAFTGLQNFDDDLTIVVMKVD
ncbi:SpoIIE family protein phosphatase [Geobacter argillaceus]|nr:SpoIIE family protein phosphatase [Geobacter argillaceus]